MNKEPTWIEVPKRSKTQWDQDEKCYFLIRPNKDKKRIEVRVMNYNKEVLADYHGKCPEDIYYNIINDGWITKLQHAAYLGSELQKVFIAIASRKEYTQDKDLEF